MTSMHLCIPNTYLFLFEDFLYLCDNVTMELIYNFVKYSDALKL